MGKLWEKGVQAVRQKQGDELSFPCHGNSQRDYLREEAAHRQEANSSQLQKKGVIPKLR